jgi:hypothetical protein
MTLAGLRFPATVLAIDACARFLSALPPRRAPRPYPLSRPAMSSFRIRPRFEHTIELPPDAIRDQILSSLRQLPVGLEVKSFPGMIGLHIPAKDRRYWSPRLFLSLEPMPEGSTRIEGIYGPEIEIWSLYLYGYLITGMLGIFSGILGGAQLAIDSYPWGLWVFGAMALLAALLYLAAQLGQKLGAWQTFQLHQAYQTAIGRPAEIE